jgi:hypothetical protein
LNMTPTSFRLNRCPEAALDVKGRAGIRGSHPGHLAALMGLEVSALEMVAGLPTHGSVSASFRMKLLQAYEDWRCNRVLSNRRAQQEAESYSLHSAHRFSRSIGPIHHFLFDLRCSFGSLFPSRISSQLMF